MLESSLTISLLIFLLSVGAAQRAGYVVVPAYLALCLLGMFVCFPLALATLSLAPLIQFVLVIYTLSKRRIKCETSPPYWHYSLALLLLVNLIPLMIAVTCALDEWHIYEEEARQSGFVKLQRNLPDRHASPNPIPITTEGEKWLTWTEQTLEAHEALTPPKYFKTLHERMVDRFTRSPGFGVRRVLENFDSQIALIYLQNESKPFPYPSPSFEEFSMLNEEEFDESEFSLKDRYSLLEMSWKNALRFADPYFGNTIRVQPGRQYYQPHKISEDNSQGNFHLESIQLVGLLLHEEPLAYVPKKGTVLRMKDVAVVPTRSLDDFEKAGLEVLRAGQDLHISNQGSGLRVLGAIRSARQCMCCHQGARGDLLGAFSYTMTQKPSQKDE